MTRILITGSLGQIGSELVEKLREEYGKDNVIGSDLKRVDDLTRQLGPYIYLDVLDKKAFSKTIVDYDIDWIVHNASLLSAAGEKNPHLAMNVNVRGFDNAIDLARIYNLRILSPSSIAAFGPSTPKENTPDLTIMRPNTIYGISKVYIELLGEYYFEKWGVDFRSLRYPGIISSQAPPGGGTTDYAVNIFYEALKNNYYESFLSADTELPMMYMPDCLKGTIDLLKVDSNRLHQRTFNLGAMNFNPQELATSIKIHLPEFQIAYKPDFRQTIADSWPRSIDDSEARNQWGWKHDYDLNTMVYDMLKNLSIKLDIPFNSPIASI
ncbi:MAG: NAD-dependent epimerase/dehydratase family protein [Candidatus Kariarchaeaceae archaeon]|jgi:threonine 3-dehydrogenase